MANTPHPCYKCTKRTSTCHGTCPEYAPIDRGRAERCEELRINNQFNSFMSMREREIRFLRATKQESKKRNKR